MPRVLVLEADPWTRSRSAGVCRSLGCDTRVAASPAEARREALERPCDLVLADVDAGGLELLSELREHVAPPPVVLTSRRADVGTALDALRRGAADLLPSPLEASELRASLARLLPAGGTPGAAPCETDRPPAARSFGEDGPIAGRSEPLLRALEMVERVARTERSTVLVLGESGTGKELFARAVHDRSSRRDGPFVAVNCAALTDTLLEAELFGYEPGAFTGAARGGRDGLLAAARGGTLLLDEVGELAPELQAKLLRVLQEGAYRRIGGSEDRPLDARIVASTHRDLVALVQAGRFREDFFYRLNVLSIHVPPLRERAGDVPLLARRFLGEVARELGGQAPELSPEAEAVLRQRPWPGNVRELRNTLERAALLCANGVIEADDVRAEAATGVLEPSPPPALALDSLPLERCSLRQVEEALIRHVMAESEGNRSRAARVLGVNRSTLYSKLRAYRIA